MPSKDFRSIVAIAVVVASGALSAQPRPFVVAAYSDGGLVPFARFADGRWVNTWPMPSDSDVRVLPLAEIPTTWLGRPVPRQWTFWPASGSRRRVTVVGTRRGNGVGGGCTQPAVLTMDQTPVEESRGLAVDTDQVVEAVRRVPRSSTEWRHLEPVIDSAVRDNERRLVEIGSLNRPWQQEALAEVNVFQAPLSIDTVYRPVADTSPILYYFEAVRSANRKNASLLRLKVSGWVRPDSNGRFTAFALFGSVFDDDGMWSMTPLAIVRLAGHVFWIAALSRYESSSFVIRDVSPNAIRDVLTSDNGGC
jgi:hypothetical protein